MVDEVKALVFEEQTDLLSEPNFSATLQQDSFSLISCLVQDKKDKRENFGAFIEEIFHRITSSKSVQFHVIFDSYIQGSN